MNQWGNKEGRQVIWLELQYIEFFPYVFTLRGKDDSSSEAPL